ncbi:hypothetical protein BT93_C1703 [Corymbia citriodora subsp. variegata]|nr:hypothetical protein BT93_C1703 [Corymbia citriodora subsp. variegata]
MGHYVQLPYLQTNQLMGHFDTEHKNPVRCVTRKGASLANIRELKGFRHPDK